MPPGKFAKPEVSLKNHIWKRWMKQYSREIDKWGKWYSVDQYIKISYVVITTDDTIKNHVVVGDNSFLKKMERFRLIIWQQKDWTYEQLASNISKLIGARKRKTEIKSYDSWCNCQGEEMLVFWLYNKIQVC